MLQCNLNIHVLAGKQWNKKYVSDLNLNFVKVGGFHFASPGRIASF
jgi:hypothetical protein